jgi:ACS family D-galactonate transporter-like MFS transporter
MTGTIVQTRPRVDRRWWIILLLSLGMIIAYVSRSNIAVALAVPDFIHSFHLSDTDRGLLNSAFFWSYALLQIPAGWVVDRWGVKLPYAISFLLWCAASAGTALTASVPQLTALRVLLGAGEAVVAPASYRWIRFHFAEKERGLAVGLYMTGTKIGPAIGAPLAAGLIAAYDWRMMFLVLGLGGLIWLIPWMLLVPDDRRETAAAAVAASAAHSTEIPFRRILASPVAWGTVIATFAYMYFVYFSITWMPAYFVEQRHLSLSKMGLYTFFSFGGMAIVATLAGWAADLMIARGGNPVTVRKWFTIAGFAIACTELIGAQSSTASMALLFSVISLSGLGLATANYWALTQTLIPASSIGRMSGVQNCAASVAGIVAPILTGWLKQRTGSYEAPMQAIWFFLVLGVISYLVMVREKYAPETRARQKE